MAAKGGEIWRELPEERRKVYDDAYKEASRKYQAAMAEYNGQNGQSLFASKSTKVQDEMSTMPAEDDTLNQSHDNDEPVDTPMEED